jgi:hypothetical protein
VQRLRGGLVFKARILFVKLNSRLESDKEEEEEGPAGDVIPTFFQEPCGLRKAI